MKQQQTRPDSKKTKAELLIELEAMRSEVAQLHQAFRLVLVNDITQRQQAQDRLHLTQARLEHLLSASPAVMYSCQAVGEYAATFVSDNVTEMLGYDSREFLQNPKFWADRIHPNDVKRVFTQLAHLFDTGSHAHEYRFRHQDGTYRWVKDECKLVRDAAGQPLEIVGYWVDISDRILAEIELNSLNAQLEQRILERTAQWQTANQALRQEIAQRQEAEAALRDRERRYQAIFNQTFQFIGLLSLDGILLEANQTALDFGGLTHADVIGMPVWETPWWQPDTESRHRLQSAIKAAAAGEFVRYEVALIGTGGAIATVDFSLKPVWDEEGKVVLIIPEGRDISDRKQAEESLRESEAKFRQLAENLDDVVWIADANHQVIYISPAYEKIWGQSCENLYRDSSTWLQAVHPEDRPQVEQALQATTLHGGYDAEYRIIRPDGKMRWIRDRGFLIRNEAGEVYRIAGIAEDISDRKLAEVILYQRQQEFVALVENSPDVIARFDRQLRHSYINSAIEKELGIPPKAFIGKTIREMGFLTEFVNTFEPALQRVLTTEQEQIIELSTQTANGTMGFLQTRLIPETAPDGTVNSILALGRDITAIRAAEIAQRQQMEREQLINAIVQQMRESLNLEEILNTTVTQVQAFLQADRVVIYQIEPNGSGKVIAQAVAPGWKSLLNLVLSIEAFPLHTQQQYLRGKIGTLCDRDSGNIPPCLVEFMHQTQARAKLTIPIIQQHKLWGLLIVHQCSQPREWQAWESKLLQQLANKMAIAIQHSELHQQFQIELQERRQIEQALRQSETEFRWLSENSPLGIFRTNNRGEYTYINPRYQLICDCTFEEAMGRGWLQPIHPETRDFVISQNSKAVGEMKSCLSEFHFVRKDGSSRYCRVQAVPLFSDDETYIGHVGTIEDITESRAIAQMKNDFIGIVSHELRTPLTSLRGSLGLLATGVYDNKPEKGKRMLQVAAESAARLVRLVSDILDLERLESGKVTLERQYCNAADLMLQSVEAMRVGAAQNQVTLTLTPLQMQIWAAPDAIIQTLTNLLSNAIKFSAPGSTVWLSAVVVETVGAHSCASLPQPTPYVLFQVKDRGRGIPADKLETIFGQFQQVDVSDARQKGGTGLGLAICRSIIRQHEGQIWAESILGEGSSFYFTLPLNTVDG
ncbi:hypothetical protein B7486_35745 [cyanobacterium TDX16]|nr:hypothetical protein B7486_35745 [cyanobacterium TDX16]